MGRLKKLSLCLLMLISIIASYVSSVSSQEIQPLNVYAQGPYEVWGGNEECPDITTDLVK